MTPHGARAATRPTPPPSEESGGVVPMEGNGGGEGGVMADDHSAGPRLDEPRFQVDEHVIYTGEHADASAVVLTVDFEDTSEYHYTIMLAGSEERRVPEGKLRPKGSDDGEAQGATLRGDAGGAGGPRPAGGGGGARLWEMDSIRALREALSLFTASGAHYATVGPSERLGVCSRSFPLLARALEDKPTRPSAARTANGGRRTWTRPATA